MWRLALKNLTRRKSRTCLTIAGVVAAIAFMVGILSVSTGFIENFTQTVKSGNIDIYVMPEGAEGLIGFLGGGGEQKYLSEALSEEIKMVPNVETVHPMLEVQESNHENQGEAGFSGFLPTIIEAIPPEAVSLIAGLSFDTGRLFRAEESAVILGGRLANDRNLSTADTLTIRHRVFQVAGVLKTSGSLIDGAIVMPLKIAQELFDKEGRVSSFGVKVKDPGQVDETAALIQESIGGVSTITSQDFLKQVLDLLKIARAIHFSLASIALLIGILFVLTTMLMSVSERIREVGTLRAIGASRRFIFGMILSESFLISLIGGLLGIGLGVVIALGLTKLIGGLLGISFFRAVVTWGLALFGLFVALLVGLLAGFYPAWRISRANIVSALRYE